MEFRTIIVLLQPERVSMFFTYSEDMPYVGCILIVKGAQKAAVVVLRVRKIADENGAFTVTFARTLITQGFRPQLNRSIVKPDGCLVGIMKTCTGCPSFIKETNSSHGGERVYRFETGHQKRDSLIEKTIDKPVFFM